MTEEDKRKTIEVAEQLERAVKTDTKAGHPVTATFSVAAWAAARLRHLAD
jgi:hypothetical protein